MVWVPMSILEKKKKKILMFRIYKLDDPITLKEKGITHFQTLLG